MSAFLPWCWTAILILSITWYAVMIVYVGLKGGVEIMRMTRTLAERHENGPPAAPREE
jgi:hypothetical protein